MLIVFDFSYALLALPCVYFVFGEQQCEGKVARLLLDEFDVDVGVVGVFFMSVFDGEGDWGCLVDYGVDAVVEVGGGGEDVPAVVALGSVDYCGGLCYNAEIVVPFVAAFGAEAMVVA